MALKRTAKQLLRKWRGRIEDESISSFALSREEAEARRSGGDLEEIFYSGQCRLIHKWVGYLPVYERYFGRHRGSDITMIEIGVSEGGSLDMWRKYFGERATIVGVDIDPDCANRVDSPNLVRIGSQDDPEFLTSVVSEVGPPDIILDDGSHVAEHQIASFKVLWPKLKYGGFYIIEDAHTAYWPRFGGGFGKKGSAIQLAKSLVDDMHGWYHGHTEYYASKSEILSVCVFDSMVVIEKQMKERPGHIKISPRGEG